MRHWCPSLSAVNKKLFALSHNLIRFGKRATESRTQHFSLAATSSWASEQICQRAWANATSCLGIRAQFFPPLLTPQRPRRQLAPARDTNQWSVGETLWKWEAIRLTVHNRHTERRRDAMPCHVTKAKGLRTSQQGNSLQLGSSAIRTSHVQKKAPMRSNAYEERGRENWKKNRKSYEKGDENEMSFSEL